MSQTRKMSIVESVSNAVFALLYAYPLWLALDKWVLHYFTNPYVRAGLAVAPFFIIACVRGYFIRRGFETLDKRIKRRIYRIFINS